MDSGIAHSLCGALLVNGGAAFDRPRAHGNNSLERALLSLERAFLVGRSEELSCA
jgi:hypothetical protein